MLREGSTVPCATEEGDRKAVEELNISSLYLRKLNYKHVVQHKSQNKILFIVEISKNKLILQTIKKMYLYG